MTEALGSYFVLVVEDDKDIRDGLVEILIEEGYGVGAVANGALALEYLRTQRVPSVILLDLMMPVMDGWQFRNEQLKDAALASIPVIILTADGQAKQKAATMAAADGLTKPLRLHDLLQAIEQQRRRALT